MRSITAGVKVPQPRDEVFAFLDVLANHESFTDHLLIDWSFDGPRAGVGARARTRANVRGPERWIDMEVISAEPPVTSTEESIGANGRRRTRGTYTLTDLPDGGTDIRFELVFLDVPPVERLLGPLIRASLKRANARAMRRLARTLGELPSPSREAAEALS
jgi:hypothetical protein